MLQALIVDVDGTLADTEPAHLAAFNQAFAEVGLAWHWDSALYRRLLSISGGQERILHFWRMVDPELACGAAVPDTIRRIHSAKTRLYEQQVAGARLPLRPGVLRLLREARAQGLPLAIATTTTPANVDALLRSPLGPDWRRHFAHVADARSAPCKKPHPQAYLQVLQALGLPGHACMAIEDSENGLQAASAAGIPTLITPSSYSQGQDFSGALVCLPHLGDPEQALPRGLKGLEQPWVDLSSLRRWHASRRCTSP